MFYRMDPFRRPTRACALYPTLGAFHRICDHNKVVVVGMVGIVPPEEPAPSAVPFVEAVNKHLIATGLIRMVCVCQLHCHRRSVSEALVRAMVGNVCSEINIRRLYNFAQVVKAVL